jgi:23S rRNA (uridine2552-2'-O)-methyltransferase
MMLPAAAANMSNPKGSSGNWRQRQERDPYVRQARREGWRSRAVYKLAQIVEKEPILFRGMRCVDLGAAPGGWSQYVAETLGHDVRIVAVDLLPMDALPCVDFIQADIQDEGTVELIRERLGGDADLVMSDMAPNITGTKAIDQPRAMHLAQLALDVGKDLLRRHGDFVCKLFQGAGSDTFVREVRGAFKKVRVMKPKASRPGSNEIYLVARNYQL